MKEGVFLILDFGSQYTWLIARTLRELGFYSRVERFDFPLENVRRMKPAGIVISGGPASVGDKESPSRDLKKLAETAPLLGVCYGMQMICQQWGGEVKASGLRTYGSSRIFWTERGRGLAQFLQHSLEGVESSTCRKEGSAPLHPPLGVWMSHGDFVSRVPEDFHVMAQTDKGVPAVLGYGEVFFGDLCRKEKPVPQKWVPGKKPVLLGLQFHPEVSHTQRGKEIVKYFARQVCGVRTGGWTPAAMLSYIESQIKKKVDGRDRVLCALSGGVDSTVTAVLLTRVLGPERVSCVFVDTGLLRKGEFEEVLSFYRELNLNVEGVRAAPEFLNVLRGVEDPERKRKIIGAKFIDIFKKWGKNRKGINCLAQGTLYPDVIESLSAKGGPSVTIKSHHNVGGLPGDLPFKLVEPLRELFKDEVRLLGQELGVKERFLSRHPFPGPGLAVRIVGEVTRQRVAKLQKADAIFMEELRSCGLYGKVWQAFCVLLSVKSVGVQGDGRTYEEVVALRAITSRDGMTADWFAFDSDFLHRVSDRITNEVSGINRVVYDVTSKPPGTIEWL